MDILKTHTKKNIVNVPYKGTPDVIGNLLNGDLTLAPLFYNHVSSYINTDKFFILAVDTNERLANLPNVPTLKEFAIKAFADHSWFAVFSNQSINKKLQEHIQKALVLVLNDPVIVSQLYDKTGLIVDKKNITPKKNFIEEEKRAVGPLVKN